MKKKALALAMYMACAAPTMAATKSYTNSLSGLNLGEVKSKSYLGEPFKGYIPILFTSKSQSRNLSVKLAPRAIFAQAGAEKVAELDYLNFRVSTRRGKPVIVVSSHQAINLPILNIILEINTPSGVIYQDYTIMLNPPKHRAGHRAKYSTKHKKHKKKLPKTYFSPRTLKKYTSKYTVRSGDSLSIIALTHKHKGISLKRMIYSIVSANPHAFPDHNINHLQKGVVLHIPSSKEIKNFKSIANKTKRISKLNTYKVKRGDNLSKITKRFVYQGVSFTKMMRAIHKTNPQAFSRNNINILKTGVRLRIPTYIEVAHKHQNKNKNKSQVNTAKKTPITTIESNNNKKNLNSNVSENTANQLTINSLQKRIRELRNKLDSVNNTNNELKELISKQEFKQTAQKEKLKRNIRLKAHKKPISAPTNTIATTNVATNIVAKKIKPTTQHNKKTELNNLDDYPVELYDSDEVIVENAELSSINDTELSNLDLSEAEGTNASTYALLLIFLGFGILLYKKRKTDNFIIQNNSKLSPSFDAEKLANNLSETTRKNDKNTVKFNDTLTTSTTSKAIEAQAAIISNSILESNSTDQEKVLNNNEIETSVNETLFAPNLETNAILDNNPDEIDNNEYNNSGISEEAIQECDKLVDDLIQELSSKPQNESLSPPVADNFSSTQFSNMQENKLSFDPLQAEAPSEDISKNDIADLLLELERLEKITPSYAAVKTNAQKEKVTELEHE